MKSYSLRDFLCIRFRPFWHIIHLEFTNFTFLLNRPIHRQCRVKGYSRFPASVLTTRMHGAYNLYARCLGEICIDTGERERSFTLYCR